jgi:hypothetical protein
LTSKLTKFWLELRAKLLSIRQPITSFHWRFLLPNQSKSVNIHRYVFTHSHTDFPIILSGLAYVYNLGRWWLYFAWIAIFKAYKKAGKKCLEEHSISKLKQLCDLFILAFGYCIPPMEYYVLRLYQWPRTNWLDFTYDFQANSWHAALNYPNAKITQQLICDKAAFEMFLSEHRLPTIESLHVIKKGIEITPKELASLPETSFFKPTNGNRSAGCFALQKDDSIDHDAKLRFIWFKGGSEMPHKDSKDLNRLIASRDYLIQPLLKNHPDFEQLFGTDKLATIRLITCNAEGKCTGISAVLETAMPYKPMLYWNVAIDISTGEFIEPIKHNGIERPEFDAWFATLRGQKCPQWQALLTLCTSAHDLLPELLTIGWDVSLEENGPTIVEGNISWGLQQHQVLTQTPLLQSELGEVYNGRILG